MGYIFWVDLYVAGRHVLLDYLIEHFDVSLGIGPNPLQDFPILFLPKGLLHVLNVHLHELQVLIGYFLLHLSESTMAMRYLSLPSLQ